MGIPDTRALHVLRIYFVQFSTAIEDAVTHPYHDTIFLIERLHRHFLEVVKLELPRTRASMMASDHLPLLAELKVQFW